MGAKNTKPKVQAKTSDSNADKHRTELPASAQVKEAKEVKSTATVVLQVQPLHFEDLQEVTTMIFNDKHPELERIIWDFSFDNNTAWLARPFTFFGISSLQKQILALAHYAAPLNKVEAYIRKAHANKEAHLPATLVQATVQAIRDLDVTIYDEKSDEIAEGMAERLLRLHAELYPSNHPNALAQIRLAVPIENKEVKEARELANAEAVVEVFEAFKKNDGHTTGVIKSFEEFVKHTTQLNRLHLLFLAFRVLKIKGSELPNKKQNNKDDCWHRAFAGGFCYEVIGPIIEVGFSPRMQQILRKGISYVLNRSINVERQLDVKTEAFHPLGDSGRVRHSSYFDAFGWVLPNVKWDVPSLNFFKIYYEQLHESCELIGYSIEEPLQSSSPR